MRDSLSDEDFTLIEEEDALPIVARLRHPNPKHPLLHLSFLTPEFPAPLVPFRSAPLCVRCATLIHYQKKGVPLFCVS